jgi:D-glycero-D-manno-heptose 1,7-bisphosphate phosphatase
VRDRLSAVFLDRDGVINRKAPEGSYVTSWAEFAFLPGALEALARLAHTGVPTFIATNQRGIARGAMSEADLADIHRRMCAEVHAARGRIDAIYHCPHEGGCDCRKPLPGMFERAAREHGLRLAEAVVVGDRESDMRAAAAVGAGRVLVGAEDVGDTAIDHRAEDLPGAIDWLIAERL